MKNTQIAYFSMEIALEEGVPTYSGGLGILAGDMVRSASDLKIPLYAVTLLYRKGYFFQKLNSQGIQSEMPVEWIISDFLQELPQRIEVNIEGRKILVGAWQYNIRSKDGYIIPVFLLDTDLAENSAWDRAITHYLYPADACKDIIKNIFQAKDRLKESIKIAYLENYDIEIAQKYIQNVYF